MGKLYRKTKEGNIIQELNVPVGNGKGVAPQPKANVRTLIPENPNIGSIKQVKRSIPAAKGKAPAPTITPRTLPATNPTTKNQPAEKGNEMVLKQTISLPDVLKTNTLPDYRKALATLKDEAAKSDFNTDKLEAMIAGEQRLSVLKEAEKIRTKLTTL